jgi:hypothetical protein
MKPCTAALLTHDSFLATESKILITIYDTDEAIILPLNAVLSDLVHNATKFESAGAYT